MDRCPGIGTSSDRPLKTSYPAPVVGPTTKAHVTGGSWGRAPTLSPRTDLDGGCAHHGPHLKKESVPVADPMTKEREYGAARPPSLHLNGMDDACADYNPPKKRGRNWCEHLCSLKYNNFIILYAFLPFDILQWKMAIKNVTRGNNLPRVFVKWKDLNHFRYIIIKLACSTNS